MHPPIEPRRARIDALLRTLLAGYLGLPGSELRFARQPQGRPHLAHAQAPDFNLTDTAGGVLVAVARRGCVGVDAERSDRRLPAMRLARRWFATDEADALAALDDTVAQRAFVNLWTAKEAACKATGTGISGYLQAWRFAVETGDQAPRLRDLPAAAGPASAWTFHRLTPTPAHTAVLACRDLPVPPRLFVLTG